MRRGDWTSISDGGVHRTVPSWWLPVLAAAYASDPLNGPNIRGFVIDLIDAHRGWSGPGDIDGGTFQELAEKHGVFVVERRAEQCGDVCECAEYGDWPLDCYRTHPSLLVPASPEPDKETP